LEKKVATPCEEGGVLRRRRKRRGGVQEEVGGRALRWRVLGLGLGGAFAYI
jgi:hypothetical protein